MLKNISLVVITDLGIDNNNLLNDLLCYFSDILFVYNAANVNFLCKNKWIYVIHYQESLPTELMDELSYIFYYKLQDRYKSYLFNIGAIVNDNYEHIETKGRLFNKDYIKFDFINLSTVKNKLPMYLLNNYILKKEDCSTFNVRYKISILEYIKRFFFEP